MEDGHKALTFLEQGGEADLILSDVMMPVMDGFELVSNRKKIPGSLLFQWCFSLQRQPKNQRSKVFSLARVEMIRPKHKRDISIFAVAEVVYITTGIDLVFSWPFNARRQSIPVMRSSGDCILKQGFYRRPNLFRNDFVTPGGRM